MPTRCCLKGLDPAYSAVLNRFPPLSPEGEQKLHLHLTDLSVRKLSVRKQLVEGTLRLAAKIALRFRGRGVSIDELVEEANFALVQAGEKFDPSKGARFATFATLRIVGHLTNVVGRDLPPENVGEPEERGAEPAEPADGVRDELAFVTADLSERDRDILLARRGNGETFQAIGKRFSLSIEGVRRIEERAMATAQAAAAGRTR